MAIWHEVLKDIFINRRWTLLTILVAVFAVTGFVAADAQAVINLQAVQQRSKVAAYHRCKDDEISSRTAWECPSYRWWRHDKKTNWRAWGCVYRSLTFRKASCETEYFLRHWDGRKTLHCYGRATWRGNGNDIRQSGRYRIDCVNAYQSRVSNTVSDRYPVARAAHVLSQAATKNALQCGNGDCDIYDAIGAQPFTWGSFWRIAGHEDHDVRQQILYGPGFYCKANFRAYFPNTSNTIYDNKTYQSCVA